jgi:CRISPR-associated protein Csa3
METVHIIPVGFSKEKLIDSLRRYPFQKVYLLIGKNESLEGEGEARKTAREMKRDLQGVAEVKVLQVDKEDVFEAVKELIRIVKDEKARGNEVMINVSGSMRTLGIACYLAASLTGAKIYAGISKYGMGKEKPVGVEKVIEIPLFPAMKLSKEKEDVLRVLYKNGGEVGSLEDIIAELKSWLKPGTKEYRAERSRVSYLVNGLKEDGLVEAEKSGKVLRVRLSKLGEIYAMGRISSEKVTRERVE